MEFTIHAKALPLIRDLHEINITNYLASNEFERVLAKFDLLNDWQELLQTNISFGNYYDRLFQNFSTRQKAFAALIGNGFENAEPNEFYNFLFEMLLEYLSVAEINTDRFTPIAKDLSILNFPSDMLKRLLSKLSIGSSESTDSTQSHSQTNNNYLSKKSELIRKAGKIFISHSSKDKTIIDSFIQKIMLLGLEIDRNDIFCSSIEGLGIRTGDDFRDKIKEEITTSEIVIIMLSQHYKKSEICQNEMGAAWVLSKKVIPIIIPPLNYDDVGALRITEHIDRINSNGGVDNIIHTLKDLLGISIKDMRFINKQRDEFLNSFKLQNSGAERVNDQIKKTFMIDDSNAIAIIFHIGSYTEGIHRTQDRLIKLTGFDAAKIDTIVNSYPDILRRSRSSSGKTIYRLQDSAKLKFDENIKL